MPIEHANWIRKFGKWKTDRQCKTGKRALHTLGVSKVSRSHVKTVDNNLNPKSSPCSPAFLFKIGNLFFQRFRFQFLTSNRVHCGLAHKIPFEKYNSTPLLYPSIREQTPPGIKCPQVLCLSNSHDHRERGSIHHQNNNK